MKTPFTLIFVLISGCVSGTYFGDDLEDLQKICQTFGSKKLNLLADNVEIAWSLKDALLKAGTIGAGEYGKIFESEFPGHLLKGTSYETKPSKSGNGEERAEKPQIAKVAIKKAKLDDNSLTEIKATLEMTKKNIGTHILGCQLELIDTSVYELEDEIPDDAVYLVLEKHWLDLADPRFLAKFHEKSADRKIVFYAGLFEQVLVLFESGYLHNDIKPANIMYDYHRGKLVLIDFGAAQSTEHPLMRWGSEWFNSPSKFAHGNPSRLADDLFSLAVAILSIENDNDTEALFKDKNGRFLTQCSMSRPVKCRENMRSRGAEILERRGFPPKMESEYFINFTDLILEIIEYDHFKREPKEIKTLVSAFAQKALKNREAVKNKLENKPSQAILKPSKTPLFEHSGTPLFKPSGAAFRSPKLFPNLEPQNPDMLARARSSNMKFKAGLKKETSLARLIKKFVI